MWQKVGTDMEIPWRTAEAMHRQLVEDHIMARGNAPLSENIDIEDRLVVVIMLSYRHISLSDRDILKASSGSSPPSLVTISSQTDLARAICLLRERIQYHNGSGSDLNGRTYTGKIKKIQWTDGNCEITFSGLSNEEVLKICTSELETLSKQL